VTVPDPIRVDHMKRTLRSVFKDALSELSATGEDNRFVWVKQGVPRPARPFVGLQIITGPDEIGITKAETRFREAIDSTRVTILSAADDTRYRIRVNGLECEIDSGTGATITSIRDALQASTLAMSILGIGEPVTLAAVSTDAFDVIPNSPGDLVGVSTDSPSTEIALVDSTSDVWASETVADVEMTVQVAVYDSGDAAPDTTRRLCGRLRASLDLPDTLDAALSARVAMRTISRTNSLAGLEPGGAMLQAQSSFDVAVGGSSLVARIIEPIETVEIDLDVSGNTSTITVP